MRSPTSTPILCGCSPPRAFSPPPPLAGLPASVAVSSVTSTSAIVTVTPPSGGCTPVSYIVSHALAFRADAPSLTTVRAGQSVTARLGSLVPGET